MARAAFFTTEKLGPKQSLTPEGFLLCEEVPIARIGMMIYGPNETPIDAGPEGLVKIFREPEDLFVEQTFASLLGKPVVNDHPEDDVTPETWKELAHGVVLNPRRGSGAMDDLLLADLLITTEDGIKLVRGGKVEVSCGYEADYEEIGPGQGKQTNFIYNHLALVEQGRCGPRCAISDKKPDLTKGVSTMKMSKIGIKKILRRVFKANDAEMSEAELNKAADEVIEGIESSGEGIMGDEDFGSGEGGGDTHIHIHNDAPGAHAGGVAGDEGEQGRARFTDDDIQEHMDQNAAEHSEMFARIEALEKLVAELAGEESGEQGESEDNELEAQMLDEFPEEVKEEAGKAKDSAYLANPFKDTVAKAEILVPGIRVPNFTRDAKKTDTFKKICGLRRTALDLAYTQPGTRPLIDDLLAGKTLDTKNMTCDAARTLFNAAAAAKRALNNSNGSVRRTGDKDSGKRGVMSIADLNKRNAELYGKR